MSTCRQIKFLTFQRTSAWNGSARERKGKEMRLEAVLEEAIDFHSRVLIRSQGRSIDPI